MNDEQESFDSPRLYSGQAAQDKPFDSAQGKQQDTQEGQWGIAPPPSSNTKLIITVVTVFILAILGIAGWYFFFLIPNNTAEPVACTQEAKQCPDGSYVSRVGTNCEFAPCTSEALCEGGECPNIDIGEKTTDTPSSSIAPATDWKIYRNTEYNFQIEYPENYRVEESPGGTAIVGFFHKDASTKGSGLKIYLRETGFYSLQEYKNYAIDVFEKQVKKDTIDLSKFSYSFREKRINNSQVILHKRDFYALLGNVYDMDVWVGDGTVLEFSSEDDNEILDTIYHSFKTIEF